MLCREIHSSIKKSLSLLDERDTHFDQLNEIFLGSKKVAKVIKHGCIFTCMRFLILILLLL
jgi:hypothetical protein